MCVCVCVCEVQVPKLELQTCSCLVSAHRRRHVSVFQSRKRSVVMKNKNCKLSLKRFCSVFCACRCLVLAIKSPQSWKTCKCHTICKIVILRTWKSLENMPFIATLKFAIRYKYIFECNISLKMNCIQKLPITGHSDEKTVLVNGNSLMICVLLTL